jgi:hypothetical protein
LIIRYYDYESDSDGECPPTPEPATLESEDYIDGDEAFSPYLRNCPGYADIALEHYNSQKKNEVIFSSRCVPFSGCMITYYYIGGGILLFCNC